MNTQFLNYLRCPACHGKMSRLRGALVCGACNKRWNIQSGIPILVDLSVLPEHLSKQVAYFEKEDQSRAVWRLEQWQERYVENFLSWGKPKQKGLIMDNAAGSGYMTVELARRGFRIIATDLTVAELIKLKHVVTSLGLDENVLLVCCDSQKLPLAASVADGLVANAILEHLPDEKQAVAEITRVVKPKAPVMVAMPIAYHLLLPFLWLPNWIHDLRIGHLRRYTRQSILEAFTHFTEVRTYYTGHLLKVVCLFLYVVTKRSRWNALGERLDRVFETVPYGANNVVSVLKKR